MVRAGDSGLFPQNKRSQRKLASLMVARGFSRRAWRSVQNGTLHPVHIFHLQISRLSRIL